MKKMHGRSFLERKVFVTSVVGASPKKSLIVQPGFHANSEDTSSSNSSPSAATDKISITSSSSGPTTSTSAATCSPSPIASTGAASGPVFTTPVTGTVSSASGQTSTTSSLISGGVQEKVDIFSLKLEKRKAEESPEQQNLTKKDKQKLKDQAKSLKKKEELDKKQVHLSPTKQLWA